MSGAELGRLESFHYIKAFTNLHQFDDFNRADFRAEREKRDAKERDDKKKVLREQKEQEREEQRKRAEDAELKSYSSLQSGKKTTNYDSDGNNSDDFM